MKILLLEDNKRLSKLIIEALWEKNYKIDWFEDGIHALNAVHDGYDCFILDINVPGIDGLSLLKEIRVMDKKTPAIIISANVELETIKDAYTNGCDEYIKKPFYIYELELKLNKFCKKEKEIINLLENYTYNTSSELLYDENKQEIKLAKKEILLLNLFIKNCEKIVTFEHIEQYVWEGDLTTNESIRTLVKRLRKKLPKDTITSQIGIGYKLQIS
ncbi:response regulator transcription factor [Arcobacter sp. KX21116]|jgi:DNA-binding response OmpR family regulator|uniref:response regulator transcription factor n=1 Tax=Arcobacter iocasae TaxID=2906515 RepID=UPI0035D454C1|tara:strand:+ start:47911 stop:48558 length:648 start_codon:yes stop_codon:yes gene_type:complete